MMGLCRFPFASCGSVPDSKFLGWVGPLVTPAVGVFKCSLAVDPFLQTAQYERPEYTINLPARIGRGWGGLPAQPLSPKPLSDLERLC